MRLATKLERLPSTKTLYKSRITTLRGLHEALGNKGTAFIALDTEHVETARGSDNLLHQVGLAYTQTLASADSHVAYTPRGGGRPRPQEFYTQTQIQGLTLNITISDETREVLGPQFNIPSRSPHRFGAEEQVSIGDVEESIIAVVQRFAQANTNLILVGFQSSVEWAYLERHFPGIVPYFSSWMDVRDIAKDIAPIGNLRGLKKLLYIFGYDWKDIDAPVKGYNADNAGDDAVFTLAAANALLCPENQERLKAHQACTVAVDTFARHKGYVFDGEVRHPHAAMIQCETGTLPRALNSGMRLVYQFLNFAPESGGILNAELACLTFKSHDELVQFVQATHRLILPTGHVLSAAHNQAAAQRYDEARARAAMEGDEKRAARRMRKLMGSRNAEGELGIGT